MSEFEFKESHYDQMLVIDEDYKSQSFESLRSLVENGKRIVDKYGFKDLPEKLSEDEMEAVGAYIDFRLAKKDLGEYVEEINE